MDDGDQRHRATVPAPCTIRRPGRERRRDPGIADHVVEHDHGGIRNHSPRAIPGLIGARQPLEFGEAGRPVARKSPRSTSARRLRSARRPGAGFSPAFSASPPLTGSSGGVQLRAKQVPRASRPAPRRPAAVGRYEAVAQTIDRARQARGPPAISTTGSRASMTASRTDPGRKLQPLADRRASAPRSDRQATQRIRFDLARRSARAAVARRIPAASDRARPLPTSPRPNRLAGPAPAEGAAAPGDTLARQAAHRSGMRRQASKPVA